MASGKISSDSPLKRPDETEFFSFGGTLRTILQPLASLKLTVTLFALAIFIVLAGTLAQVQQDIWDVINGYFRLDQPVTGIESFFVRIPLQIFFPPSFWHFHPPQVPSAFWFPRGWVIGAGMAANLGAAFLLRFLNVEMRNGRPSVRFQAKGGRLWAGFGLLAAGGLATAMVILSGSNKDGVQDATWLQYSTLWRLFQLSLAGIWLTSVYGAVTISPQRKAERWSLIGLSVLLGGVTCWLLYLGDRMPLAESSMRILWQLMKAEFAAAILLGGCVLLFRKRGGVVLLHGGIVLIMVSEILVGLRAVEEQMVIEEGQTVNKVQDIRHMELAVIDTSDPDADHVVAVPLERLEWAARNKQPVTGEALPFDVQMVEFIRNTNHRRLKADEKTPATEGIGTQWTVDSVRPVTGTDSGGGVDSSAGYFKFTTKDGKDLGTWLLGRFLSDRELPQTVTIGDKIYNVYLRFKTSVKPYKIYLEDVSKEDYVGTSTPRDYSSVIRLIDENVNQRVKIWMNNPLRYAGETFYQSNYAAMPELEWDPVTLDARPKFTVDPQTGQRSMRTVEVTTLSVVRNAGWMIPYVACMIVATGMLTHFLIVLERFLNRRATAQNAAPQTTTAVPRRAGHAPAPVRERTEETIDTRSTDWSMLHWIVPAGTVLLFAVLFYALAVRTPKTSPSEMDFRAFGRIPVIEQGRAKPLDTVARNTLRMISKRQTYPDAITKRKEPAIRWLLDMIARPDFAVQHQIFRIDNDEVLNALKLEKRESHQYSVEDLRSANEELLKQNNLAQQEPKETRSPFQRSILDLAHKVQIYLKVAHAFQLPDVPPLPTREQFRTAPEMAQQQLKRTFDFVSEFREQGRKNEIALAVPLGAEAETKTDTKWESYSSAVLMAYMETQLLGHDVPPPVEKLGTIFEAYKEGNAREFNRRVADYRTWLEENTPDDVNLSKTSYEAYFNHLAPFFYAAWFLYLPAFILSVLAWLGWSRVLNRSAFWLIAFTFAIHTFALVSRIYISGRPPVTNLYSSAVFIGWGAVLLGMIHERIFKLGMGNMVSAVAGFGTLLIADYLADDGDTLTVLQAVLDTQFWLATHVTSITLGYATTYVAGLLGLIYVARGFLTPTLTPALSKDLSRMIYGTVCFSIFFSFVGTVLGGLWADDSWGRFWGWDTKENGALIIVIWNALVLHARWDGLVKDRGLALLAIGGNIVTSWSWFGVNQLGVGLHSYGFTDGVIRGLTIFAATQLAMIALGALPKSCWWSFQRHRQLPTDTQQA